MKPISHGRKAWLWVGRAAALWLTAAPEKAPAESADEVPAVRTKLLRYADISRDRVVFAYGGDLWIAPREGGAARRLTSHVGDELYPKFSPDGKWIAFTGEYDGNPDVYDLKNNTYEELPKSSGTDMFPMWHGNSIYFISDRDGVMNLYGYDLGTKQTTKLTDYKEYDIKWPSLGPDAIVYGKWRAAL